MSKLSTRVVAVIGAIVGVLALPGYAFAAAGDPYTPATALTDATSFAGTLTSSAAPVVLAIAGAVIGLMLLGWAIRTVFSKVRRYAKV